MLFLLVRSRTDGRLVHREILDPTGTVHAFDSPIWDRLAERTRDLTARYAGAEVITGVADSVEAFLRDHPEYQEPWPADG